MKVYREGWDHFGTFADVYGLRKLPAEPSTVVCYIAFLEGSGLGGRANTFVCAISWFHNREGAPDPVQDKRVKMALAGLRKTLAEERNGEKLVREPFPIEALRKWTENPQRFSVVRRFRDPAMIAIGIRCMRRPGELTELRRRNVCFEDGRVKIFLEKSKTDQLRVGRWLNVDAVPGSSTCPVLLLKRHMDTVSFRGKDDYLFSTSTGSQLSTSAVSDVVRNMVRAAGMKVNASGHSLRIAGATLAVKAGWEMAEICAVGGWRSDAVLRYMRDCAVAEKGGSSSMGF